MTRQILLNKVVRHISFYQITQKASTEDDLHLQHPPRCRRHRAHGPRRQGPGGQRADRRGRRDPQRTLRRLI